METFRLFFVISLQICTAGAMEWNCFDQLCTIGYQFCEPQKMICRQCSDFDEYCFKDNLHIANCSTYCKETVTTRDTCSCNTDLWIYIPTGVSIIVICLSLGHVIYRRCHRYRKVRHNLSPSDTTSTGDETEQKYGLMTADSPPKDQVVYLRRLEDEMNGNNSAPVPNGFVPLNQVSPTNEDTCGVVISFNDKTLNPRDID